MGCTCCKDDALRVVVWNMHFRVKDREKDIKKLVSDCPKVDAIIVQEAQYLLKTPAENFETIVSNGKHPSHTNAILYRKSLTLIENISVTYDREYCLLMAVFRDSNGYLILGSFHLPVFKKTGEQASAIDEMNKRIGILVAENENKYDKNVRVIIGGDGNYHMASKRKYRTESCYGVFIKRLLYRYKMLKKYGSDCHKAIYYKCFTDYSADLVVNNPE